LLEVSDIMMKIAIIYAFKESSWFSCTKITQNLLESYKRSYSEEQLGFFDYDFQKENFEIEHLAEEIHSFNPDKLVFIDHNPHPLTLLNELSLKKYNHHLPETIIHVFGCFSLHFQEWLAMSALFQQSPLKFICASDRQVAFVRQFFKDENSFISKAPFPVSESEFSYEKPSFDLREELGIEKEAKIILYTGRLSLQKRIIELLDLFNKAYESGDIARNSYLLLAGKFDSQAFQFGNIYQHEGEYFRMVDKKLSEYSSEVLSHIKFIGSVKNSKLKDYYNQTDLFVSLSTYHDEDYGMSVAEAGSCGCPMLLTNWAGFASFKKNDSCQLVEAYLTDKQPEFNKQEAYEKFVKLMNHEYQSTRKETAIAFVRDHSISAVAEMIQMALETKTQNFTGFNQLFERLAYRESKYSKPFYDDIERVLNSNYKEVYQAYVREN
jgi:glycosyltransferase involved in cell wall biosynthesis